MKPDNFEFIATMLKQRSGLIITPDKAYLLESRLMPIARKRSLETLDDLIVAMRTKRDETLLRDVTHAMTTNETFFFRDQRPFDQFRQVLLPQLIKNREGKKHLRIWSAAASSGQEAYSLAMICTEEAAKLKDWKIDILGTDLSSEIITKAKEGIYTQFEVQRGLPITMVVKYFDQLGDKWQIKQNIRDKVKFREGNLLNDIKMMGTHDVIYCRNVLIYFDQPTKARVLEALAGQLAPDGALFLGGAETVVGITDKFRLMPDQRGLYVLTSAKGADEMLAKPRMNVSST